MPLPIGTIFELSFGWSYNQQRYLNVLHYRTVTQPTGSPLPVDEELAILTKVQGVNQLYAKLLNVMCQDVNNEFIRCQAIDPVRYVPAEVQLAGSGLVLSNLTTGNIAAVITKRTQFAGRNQVGGFHLVGVPSAEMSEGELNNVGGWYGDLLSFSQILLDNIVTSTSGIYEPVIYHRDTQPTSATRLFSTIIQPQVRILRRRTVGVGK